MDPKRVAYWKNRSTWTIYDLVFLLSQLEPKPCENLDEDIRQDMKAWNDWAPGCPELNPYEKAPMATPVNAKKLLAWASSLEGVEIPDCWRSMLPTDNVAVPNETKNLSNELGARERDNLLLTIGAFALALAKASGPRTGDTDDPNISQLAKSCIEQAGDSPAMALATVRDRISKGIKILRERR